VVLYKNKVKALSLAVSWTYKSSRTLTFILFLSSILAGFLTILEPYVLKLLLDFLIHKETQFGLGLLSILLLYGGLSVARDLFYDIMNTVKSVHGLNIESYAMHELMNKVSSLDLIYFEDPDYYNTLTRSNSALIRLADFFWQFSFFISSIVSVVVIVSAILTFNPWIVLLIIIGTTPSLIVGLKTAEVVWSAFTGGSPIFRHAHYYRSLLTEQPEALKEIKLFNLKDYFLRKFRALFSSFVEKQNKAAKTQFRRRAFTTLFEGLFAVAAAYLVVQMFIDGTISVGDLTFLLTLLFQFAGYARLLVQSMDSLNQHATFLTPLVDVMGFEPVIKEPRHPKPFPSKIRKGIEFRNVSFTYPRRPATVLRNFNLFIKPSESLAIVGENGSGKTTLIKLMCRLYDVTEGEILVDGVNIKEFKLNDLYNNIGVIFQDFMKYEALVEENIAFGKTSGLKLQIHKAAIKSGAADFIKRLERQYKTQLGKKIMEHGTDLSGGQWQKIALARAFFKNPQVLILDEPTAAVDAKAEFKIFKRFEQFTKNKITFLISHRFSTVRIASRILVMDKGRLLEDGTHEELIAKNGHYAKLFNMQAKGYV